MVLVSATEKVTLSLPAQSQSCWWRWLQRTPCCRHHHRHGTSCSSRAGEQQQVRTGITANNRAVVHTSCKAQGVVIVTATNRCPTGLHRDSPSHYQHRHNVDAVGRSEYSPQRCHCRCRPDIGCSGANGECELLSTFTKVNRCAIQRPEMLIESCPVPP